ncbi:MAG: hypothetical protein WAM85_19415 [Terracidiphilus sp.]
MPEQLENSSTPIPAETLITPVNPAVAHCREVWERTYKATLETGAHRVAALFDASSAYCRAIPPLSGAQNIRDFIACVANGMITNVIGESKATKLLYAAQVAHNTLPKRAPRPTKPAA